MDFTSFGNFRICFDTISITDNESTTVVRGIESRTTGSFKTSDGTVGSKFADHIFGIGG